MIIGIANNAYPEKRCITCIDDNIFVNLKENNLYYYTNFVKSKLIKSAPDFIFTPVFPLKKHKIDILHFFNYIPKTSLNYVITFETAIPRIGETMSLHRSASNSPFKQQNKKTRRLLETVAKDNCIGLIAISQSALNIQLEILSAYPDLKEKIVPKLRVLHPAQPLHITQKVKKERKTAFMFIGKEFYRKGGAEVILAFSELLEEGRISDDQVTLTVIGDTDKQNNYLHNDYPDESRFYHQVEAKMAAMRCLVHHKSMPNEEVIKKMIESDVGLLPTWGDTYGFSVLEMQSCGCPVISTNVRALPEINASDVGWQIPLNLNPFGEVVINSLEEKQQTRKNIINTLKEIIVDVVNHPDCVADKAENALLRIKTQHDPETYKRTIQAIYTQASA